MAKHDLHSEQALFLVMDLQEKLMRVMERAQGVLANTNLMLAVCRQLKIPVLVTEQYPKGLGHTVSEVAEQLGEYLLFEKITFSAATAEFLEQLRGLGRRQIVVVGSETHVCVFQTVRDLVSLGYQVYVLSDGVCSRRQANHENGLRLMQEEGAVVTDTETVIFDLFKAAGSQEFKAIQRLLK